MAPGGTRVYQDIVADFDPTTDRLILIAGPRLDEVSSLADIAAYASVTDGDTIIRVGKTDDIILRCITEVAALLDAIDIV